MSNDIYARALMGSTLAIHIIFAIIGMGLPLFISIAELVGIRRNDRDLQLMARRWTKALTILFAVGSVTGTAVAFELTLLWPNFMQIAGQVISLPFAIEGFAFFIEAIFLGLYVYAWDRFSNRMLHWLCSLPIIIAAGASGMLITTVNAFMNSPVGFRLDAGQVKDVQPVQAMLNPMATSEVLHVLVTAYLCVAFLLAGMAAYQLLRGRSLPYFKKMLTLGTVSGFAASLLAVLTGDMSAKDIARYQPAKLAAAEALFDSQASAPLTIGGIVDPKTHQVIGGIQIPGLLSWLAYGDVNHPVQGLNAFPKDQWPLLSIHYAFDTMVGIGFYVFGIGLLFVLAALFRRQWMTHRLLLLGILGGSVLSFLAMELGWMVTELGRQPWILYHMMTVQQALTSSSAVAFLFYGLLSFFVLVSIATVYILVSYFRAHPLPMLAEKGPGPEDTDQDGDLPGGERESEERAGSAGEKELVIYG
jgi:cytochrome d ubiquinol oxidase subunit I